MERRILTIEANVALCLNYVRAIASRHLAPEQIADIEAAHARREAELMAGEEDDAG